MFARFEIILIALLAIASPLAAQPASSAPFSFPDDTFSFANETVWNYVGGTVHAESPGAKKREYTRHCFVVTRAAVQFWKFARFDPSAKPLPDDQLAARIRQVTGRSVWLPAPGERIVFPGYASLREISAAHPGIFQANIGLGWPVYFRAGNMPIVAPADRSTEARLNREICRDLKKGQPSIVWLYRFPSLQINHVVVIFAVRRDHDLFRYTVYDPNYSAAPKHLEFNAATQTFSYQPTFYFKGGDVTARAIYRGVLR